MDCADKDSVLRTLQAVCIIHCGKGKKEGKEVVTMLFHREEGQGLVEYALIIFLIAILLIAALTLLGGSIGNIFSSIATTVGGT